MSISAREFSDYYPRLYHMAEFGAWPSIAKHGLLSTTALLDLFEITGERRSCIELAHRPQSVEIVHKVQGKVVIRDQIPMRESQLQRCLRDMTPEEWYRMLNSQVFFWVTHDRLETLLNARAYCKSCHTVITIDTAALLSKYAENILLSPINSGNTLYKAVERGRHTFRPLLDYPFEERRRLRGIPNAVAEAAIPYGVPDLSDFALQVEHRRGPEVLEVICSKE